MKQRSYPREATTALALLVVSAGTFSCLYPPFHTSFFCWWEARAFLWMLLLLTAGLLFFIINRSSLMYICFAGCALVCYTLQKRTIESFSPAAYSRNAFNLRLGTFRAARQGALLDSTLRAIIETGSDIVAIRNIEPPTLPYIHDFLNRHGYRSFQVEPDYRHHLSIAVYARPAVEFLKPDHQCKTPYISGMLDLSTPGTKRELQLFYTSLQPDDESQYIPINQLEAIGRRIAESDAPVIAMGNFSLAPWSYDLQRFKKTTALHDSQRGIPPTSRQGHYTLLEHPTDHIFYSDHFKCISFETITGGDDVLIGVVGTYQFNTKQGSVNAKQTSQEL